MLVCFKYLLGFILLLIFILTGCSKHGPSKNPTPRYYMTVDGYLAPSLLHKINLIWLVSYNTTNPACKVSINSFEGIAAPRQKTLKYPVKQSGNYQLKLPLDYYLPGRCGWQLMTISYNAKLIGSNKTFAFMPIANYKKGAQSSKNAYSTILCKHQHDLSSCTFSGFSYFSKNMRIGMGNYTYTLKIEVKKDA